MKHALSQSVEIPEEIECEYANGVLKCRKGSVELVRKMLIPQIEVKVTKEKITLECKKGNKNQYKIIMSNLAHIRNMFKGIDKKFTYDLEAVNVHFPMTLKTEKNQLVISNFYGEKTPRHAKILPNVEVEIKGQKIVISSQDREAAGQTAANFEKATKVRKKDERIFQDGIYITKKPGREEQ